MDLLRKYPLVFFVLANVVLRLPFLNWYAAPLTDELYIMDQTFFGPGRRLPMFPSLIDVFQAILPVERWMAAKIVAMLSGVLTIVPAFYLAKKLSNKTWVPWAAAVFVALSPLVVRWSFRGMTDVTFTLFVTAAVTAAVYWLESAKASRLGAFVMFAGLSMLTRPEGMMWIPLVAVLPLVHVFRARENSSWLGGFTSLARSLWGFLPWVLWAYWRWGINQKGAYSGTSSGFFKRISPDYLGDISAHFGGYVFTSFYILGPMIFLGCFLYVSGLLKESNKLQVWSGLGILYVFLATTAISSIHFFFSIRHMIFVFPTLCVVGALGLSFYEDRWPKVVRSAVVLQVMTSLLVASLGLWVTKDSFKDLRQGAEVAGASGLSGTLYVTDFNRKKSEYFSGVKAKDFSAKVRLKKGDRVMLDSFSLSLKGVQNQLDTLQKTQKINVLIDARSRQSQFMADDITAHVRENGKARIIMNRLFRWQDFRTVVVEIVE
jgi:4-amino-4-deoxy-L-arabinose transferase-like glycosyltransferase